MKTSNKNMLDKALSMRAAGRSYAYIASKLNVNQEDIKCTVREYIKSSVDMETRREAVKLDLIRLDDMMTAVYERAKNGEIDYIDRVLKIMERKSKLMGLDAREKMVAEERSDGTVKISRVASSKDDSRIDNVISITR